MDPSGSARQADKRRNRLPGTERVKRAWEGVDRGPREEGKRSAKGKRSREGVGGARVDEEERQRRKEAVRTRRRAGENEGGESGEGERQEAADEWWRDRMWGRRGRYQRVA